jgi:hypothetical protein
VAWVDAQRQEDLYTTAIGEAEMLYGIALLPPGRRRDDLQRAAKPGNRPVWRTYRSPRSRGPET